MKQFSAFAIVTLAGWFFPANAAAGEYDYEVGVTYGSSNREIVSALGTIGPNPAPELGLATSSTDSDKFEFAATWYYSGLSDNSGPKSRAAFLSRASSMFVAYSYNDETGSFSSTGSLPPLSSFPPTTRSSKGSSHGLEAELRHVWRDSGWYALAGATRIESEIDTVFDGNSVSAESDVTGFNLGFGKYVGKSSAVELSVISSDQGWIDLTTYALSFTHVGEMSNNWQYSADVGIATSAEDYDDSTYTLGFSLFPVRELEFGFKLAHREGDSIVDRDFYEGFASWFARDHIELQAQYRENGFDNIFTEDFDSNQLSIGVNVRF